MKYLFMLMSFGCFGVVLVLVLGGAQGALSIQLLVAGWTFGGIAFILDEIAALKKSLEERCPKDER